MRETLTGIQKVRQLDASVGVCKRHETWCGAAVDYLELHIQRQRVISAVDIEIALRRFHGLRNVAAKRAKETVGTEYRKVITPLIGLFRFPRIERGLSWLDCKCPGSVGRIARSHLKARSGLSLI